MADEQRGLAISQVLIPGVALVIAGPIFALNHAGNPAYVASGVVGGVVGVGLIALTWFRYRRRRLRP